MQSKRFTLFSFIGYSILNILTNVLSVEVKDEPSERILLGDNNSYSTEVIITNCPTVPQKIKEHAEINTFVFRIEAKIANPSAAKCIRYELSPCSAENKKFWIKKVSGEIYTRKKFEKPGNRSIKVIAMSICETNSSSICSFIVNIEDINDNTPKFTQEAYNMAVVENSVTGTYIGRISATDADYNENALLSYTWSEKKTNPETRAYFNMNENTGAIFLAKEMDKRSPHRFVLIAQVQDHGEKPLSEQCDVHIMVTSRIIPSFIGLTFTHVNVSHKKDPIRISENFIHFETPIIRIRATSNLKGDARLDFEMEQNCLSGLADEPFFLDRELKPGSANIMLLYGLDYNICKNYSLSIVILNRLNGISIINMTINVDRSSLLSLC